MDYFCSFRLFLETRQVQIRTNTVVTLRANAILFFAVQFSFQSCFRTTFSFRSSFQHHGERLRAEVFIYLLQAVGSALFVFSINAERFRGLQRDQTAILYVFSAGGRWTYRSGSTKQDEKRPQHPAVTYLEICSRAPAAVLEQSEVDGNRAAAYRAGTAMQTIISPERGVTGCFP